MAQDYSQLITSEHNQRPKYTAMVQAVSGAFGSIQDFNKTLPYTFDLDTAEGVQLDQIGQWVGQTRLIPGVLLVQFFGFIDNPAALPYGEEGDLSVGGRFYDEGEPIDSTSLLADPEFRLLIRGRIVRNHAKGKTSDIVRAISFMFQAPCVIDDPGTMAIGVYIGRTLTLVERAIILNLDILPRPSGVRIAIYGYYTGDGYLGFEDQPGAKSFGEEFALIAPGLYPQYPREEVRMCKRAAPATFIGVDGYLYTAAANTARFTYNSDATALLGLLIEDQATNVLKYAEQLDNAIWTKSNTTISVDQVMAPDGTMSADKLIETTSTTTHQVSQSLGALAGLTEYTFSIYVKPDTRFMFRLTFSSADDWGSGGGASANFNLQTKTIVFLGANAATIEELKYGWFRVSITSTTVAAPTGSQSVLLAMMASPATITYTGDGVSGLFIWGAQNELGGEPSSYIKTEATAVTRDADFVTIQEIPYTGGILAEEF